MALLSRALLASAGGPPGKERHLRFFLVAGSGKKRTQGRQVASFLLLMGNLSLARFRRRVVIYELSWGGGKSAGGEKLAQLGAFLALFDTQLSLPYFTQTPFKAVWCGAFECSYAGTHTQSCFTYRAGDEHLEPMMLDW